MQNWIVWNRTIFNIEIYTSYHKIYTIKSNLPPIYFCVVAIEKGAFESPVTTVDELTDEWIEFGIK